MTSTTLELRQEPYDGPAATQLTTEVQAEYVVRYGGPDEGPIDAAEFLPPDGAFLVGYLDGEPVAMGGLRRHADDAVELRRMFVRPPWRGRGLARALLAALEHQAQQLGARRVVLESGQRQPEALALYRSSGYRPTESFGYYRDGPLSVCLAKNLG